MTLISDEQFGEFFRPYADNLEGFYEAAYWALSDELIKELIRRHLGVKPGGWVLDAGGGTGRWALWMAAELGAHVTVADKSEAMLDQARRNLAGVPAGQKVELLHCDLHHAPQLPSRHFEAVTATYGVLSFLDDPPAVFRTLHRVMKPGAIALLMSHSLSTALSSKLSRDLASPEELRELADTGIVRWAPGVPPLRVYTAQELKDLACTVGFAVDAVFGVTTLVMPGTQDFGYPYQEISPISRALEDPEFFRTALELELQANERPEWAERGVNLMIKVRKPEGES
jgi:SAM-dependent methyltransferase